MSECVHHWVLSSPDGSEDNRLAEGTCKKCGEKTEGLLNGYDWPTRQRNTGKNHHPTFVRDITFSKKGIPWYW